MKIISTLKKTTIDTPLGAVVTLADDQSLYLLEFADSKNLVRKIRQIEKQDYAVVSGSTVITERLEQELASYFKGTSREFNTPLRFSGSVFQQSVIKQLLHVGYGETCSYSQLAQLLDKPGAVRAVAAANASNPLAIVVPCHRVVGLDGKLRGYSGGLERKAWLLDLEKQIAST